MIKDIDRLKILAITCGGVALGVGTGAAGFGVGAPDVRSHLASPLNVRLPLSLDERDPGVAFYSARLLPASSYAALGLDPPTQALSRFKVRLLGDERSGFSVQIVSDGVVREPVLTLLLEVSKPGSSLVKGVDILLDPPAAAPNGETLAALKSEAGVPSSGEIARADSGSRSRWAPDHPTAPSERGPGVPVMSYLTGRGPIADLDPQSQLSAAGVSHYYGPVRLGESLSRIAERTRLDLRMPLDALIEALYQFNPNAFEGAPGALRPGAVLAVPNAAAIRALGINFSPYESPVPAPDSWVADAQDTNALGNSASRDAAGFDAVDAQTERNVSTAAGEISPRSQDTGTADTVFVPQPAAMTVSVPQVERVSTPLVLRLDATLDWSRVMAVSDVAPEAVADEAPEAPADRLSTSQAAIPAVEATATSAEREQPQIPVGGEKTHLWLWLAIGILFGALAWMARRTQQLLNSHRRRQSLVSVHGGSAQSDGIGLVSDDDQLSPDEWRQLWQRIEKSGGGGQFDRAVDQWLRDRIAAVLKTDPADDVRQETRVALACVNLGANELADEILTQLESRADVGGASAASAGRQKVISLASRR